MNLILQRFQSRGAQHADTDYRPTTNPKGENTMSKFDNKDAVPDKRAKDATKAIIEDLCDRRGLRQAWESIDSDTRKEIKHEWSCLISHHYAL